jgi:endothelin-converting enzyme
VDQYGNFTIKGPGNTEHNVSGELTLSENIADNGGLKQAFHTWQGRFKSDTSGKK